jgi:hypothetical protein
MKQLRNKAVEQKALSSPLRMAGRRQTPFTERSAPGSMQVGNPKLPEPDGGITLQT